MHVDSNISNINTIMIKYNSLNCFRNQIWEKKLLFVVQDNVFCHLLAATSKKGENFWSGET